jgi:2-(1,2-epoxy-1,2-dihydrophenyl)acetyl-CoA isomerase
MGEAPVLVTITDNVANLHLNRPDQMNALDSDTKLALLEALGAIKDANDVRAVLLTAEGRGFCVGQDLREFLRDRDRCSVEELFATVSKHFNPISEMVATMGKPVVAAIQGAAAGAGLSLALAADFRVVSSTATFTTAFTAIALSPDSGMTWHLPRIVGSAKALELLMLSPTLSADQALEIGLVTTVVAPELLRETAAELAQRLANGPTLAYERIKRLVRMACGAELAESLAAEYAAVGETGASRDHDHAIRAFVRKERPTFKGQ